MFLLWQLRIKKNLSSRVYYWNFWLPLRWVFFLKLIFTEIQMDLKSSFKLFLFQIYWLFFSVFISTNFSHLTALNSARNTSRSIFSKATSSSVAFFKHLGRTYRFLIKLSVIAPLERWRGFHFWGGCTLSFCWFFGWNFLPFLQGSFRFGLHLGCWRICGAEQPRDSN